MTTRELAHSDAVEHGGRLGLVAKGVSYVVVAVLALGVAVGIGGRPEDREGALEVLADEPFGWVLIALLALGFAGYALWRLAQALFDRDGEGEGPKGLAKRAVHAGKAVLYGALCASAVSLLVGSGGGGPEEDQATAVALGWPAGRWLVAGLGLVFLGAGAWNGFRGVSRRFRKDMRTVEMSSAEERLLDASGLFGHVARGLVFALVGIFLVRAAWQYDPEEAVGLDGALGKLAGTASGPYLLAAVAFGLLLYAVFCFVQARYRRV